jgi:hypothetical protein
MEGDEMKWNGMGWDGMGWDGMRLGAEENFEGDRRLIVQGKESRMK